GLLLVKKLLVYDPAKALPVSAFALSILPEANPNINCFQALDYFQTGRAHLLLISRTPGVAGGAMGVITLEGASPLSPSPPSPICSQRPRMLTAALCVVCCAQTSSRRSSPRRSWTRRTGTRTTRARSAPSG
ncbi:hypothetical protein FIBSPDRAFT_755920, partial [Athelia psychrophila]